MSSLLLRLCFVATLLPFAAPAGAQPLPRAFTCTTIMGGNPFQLTIFEDGLYIAAPLAGTKRPSAKGEGKLEMAENAIYYTVLSGPLLDELKVDTVHIMSATTLMPSGSDGLFECKKAK